MFQDSIKNATKFLVKGQSSNGAWRDYSLEPGESDAWVTAYVGLCLLYDSANVSLYRPYIVKACEWLKGVMREDGSWGYNDNCLPDSDSTSHCVLFLNALGESVPSKCFLRLLEFQNSDGGFATYDPKDGYNSWRISHPDVSPVVLRSLLLKMSPDHPIIQFGIKYILSQLNANGLWYSFWWTNSLYSTLANILTLEKTDSFYNKELVLNAIRGLSIPADPFQIALLGEIIVILDSQNPIIIEIGNSLINMQHEDGSWHASVPNLRVTNISCYTPWDSKDDVGYAVVDHHHLFTTATALRLLTKLLPKEESNRYK